MSPIAFRLQTCSLRVQLQVLNNTNIPSVKLNRTVGLPLLKAYFQHLISKFVELKKQGIQYP